MYAAKSEDSDFPFTQVHPSSLQVRVCGYLPVEVEVTELDAEKAGCFYAWKTSKGDLELIQPSLIQLKMCSPDFFERKISRMEGRIVPVSVVLAADPI